MKEIKRQLEDVRDEQLEWEEQIQQFFINLGQLLLKEEIEPSFREPIDQKKELIDEGQKKIISLNEILSSLNVLQEKEKDLKQRIEEYHKGMVDIYEEIGMEAYRLNKQGIWDEPGYQAVFEKLQKLEDKIQDADNDLFKLRTSLTSKGFFTKLNRKVREKTNQTIKKSAGDNMKKQYTKAGELLLEFASFEPHFQTELPELYKRYSAEAEVLEDLNNQLDDIEVERSKLQTKADVEIRNISKEITSTKQANEVLEEELEMLFLNLGKDHWENKKIPDSWKDQKDQYHALEEKRDLCVWKIEELQAQLSIDAMENDKQVLDKKRLKKLEQQEELQKDINTLEESINGIDTDMKEARKKMKKLQKQIAEKEENS